MALDVRVCMCAIKTHRMRMHIHKSNSLFLMVYFFKRIRDIAREEKQSIKSIYLCFLYRLSLKMLFIALPYFCGNHLPSFARLE